MSELLYDWRFAANQFVWKERKKERKRKRKKWGWK
jgi:hypothetical protein